MLYRESAVCESFVNRLVGATSDNRTLTLGKVFGTAISAQRHEATFIGRNWTRAVVGKHEKGPSKFWKREGAKEATANLDARFSDRRLLSDDE